MNVCLSVCLYLSIYLSIYLSMYLCIYVSMYLCMYVWMDGWMYGWMDVWMYGCMDVWMDVWMYGCMDVWMYGCMYVSICLSIYLCSYCIICIYVSMYLCIYLCKRLARGTKKPADSGFSICYFIQRYTLLVQHLLFHPEIHTAVSRACHFTQRFPMEGDCVGVHTWTGRGLGQLRGGTGAGERKRGRDTWVDTAVRQQLFREFFMHLPCHSETCRPSLQKVGAHIFSLFPNWRNRSDR